MDADHVFVLPGIDKAVNHFTVSTADDNTIALDQLESSSAGIVSNNMRNNSSNGDVKHSQWKIVSNTMTINDKFSIRTDSDKFGRNITELRKTFTDNDRKPFPTR